MINRIQSYTFRKFMKAPLNSVREAFWNILHSFLSRPIEEAKTVFNGEMLRYIKYTVKRW